jgi:hypothetical protein
MGFSVKREALQEGHGEKTTCTNSIKEDQINALPETGSLPSARWFAECNFSGTCAKKNICTQQRRSLPTVFGFTLGKQDLQSIF